MTEQLVVPGAGGSQIRRYPPELLAKINSLTPTQRQKLMELATPRIVEKYFAHIPHPKQQVFLSVRGKEAMYGGAAGGGKCLTADHDVLTHAGWVPIADVEVGDEVASWHTDGRMTWERVAASYSYRFDGLLRTSPMFRATPNHKWRAGYRSTAGEVKKWRWYDATELAPQMSLPAIGEALPHEDGDTSADEMELLGWWLSEGSGYDKNMARFSQIKPAGRQRIIELAQSLGLKHTVYEREIRIKWEAPDRDGTAYNKFIPRWAFAQKHLQALLDGLMQGDGYVRRLGWEYSSSSKQLAEDVQELATRLGMRAVLRSKKVNSDNPHWVVAAYPRKTWTLNTTLGWEKYKGRVYCITVPATSTFLVRHNGRVHVTGNSDALLMAALQFCDVPGYSALILRRTWPDLNSPGAILDRARTWLGSTDVHMRDGGRVMEFPSGARIQFGYLAIDKDKYKFQSAEYQFIGFDELTQFQETVYTYMFSRIRKPQLSCLTCGTAVRKYNSAGWKHTQTTNSLAKKCKDLFPDPKVIAQYPAAADGMTVFDVPLRMRSCTNPGGTGHDWVRTRFIDNKTKVAGTTFIPARLTDNPSLDQESYRENLEHLTPADRERLLNGDWDVTEEGEMFERHWFRPLENAPIDGRVCRFWDKAATEGGGDFTVGAKVRLSGEGQWIIEDIIRGQWSSFQTERIIETTAAADGRNVPIRVEQEPGSSGVDVIDHYRRRVLVGYNFDGIRSTGNKHDRALPLASAAEAGNVFIISAPWNKKFIDEASMFPFGSNDDQIDAASGALNWISTARRSRLIV